MLISTIRFIAKGWVEQLYITPSYFFTYYGFEWVKPFSSSGMYIVFALIALAAIGIMLGWRYRFFSVVFFLCLVM